MAKAELNRKVKTSTDVFTENGELRDTNRLINQIIEIVPSIVYIRDLRNQKNVFINRSVFDSLGYTPEEIISFGEDFAQSAMHPDDFARIPDREGKFNELKDGEIVEFEYRMRHRNGEWHWFLSRDSVFLRDDKGKPLLVIGTATDITKHKTAQEMLERYRLLSEKALDIVWMAHPDGGFVEANQAAVEAYGYTREEFLRLNINDLREKSTLPQLAGHLEKALTDGIQFETIHIRKDGTTFPVEVNATSADFGGERVILSIIRDISERKQQEKTSRNRNRQLDLLARVSQLLILGGQSEAELLETVFGEVTRAIGAEMFFNYQPDDNNSLKLSTWGGLTDNERELFETMSYGELLCGRVAESRQPIIVEDIVNTKVEGSEAVIAANFGAYAGFPLIAGERLLGTIAFVTRRKTHFEEGEVQMIQTVCDQISATLERMRLMNELNASHDTFRHLVENSPFGIYVVDADFRLSQISLGAQKVFENVRPLIGRDFAEIIHIIWGEPFASEVIARFRHTLRTGEPYHAPSTTEQREDIGETESYDWKLERITLPDGRFGVVCHFYDLSERQRYEAKLLESEDRFRSIFESIDEGFVIVEMIFEDGKPVDYRFEQANPAFTRLTGLPADVTGKTALELVPNLESFWIETYGQVALTGEPVRFENESIPMKRWFDVHASRIGGTESRRVAIVFNNITERKTEELNQRLLFRVGELIRENNDVETLLSGVARLLGERLGAARCLFNEIDLVHQTATVRSEFRRENLPSFVGTVSLQNYSELTVKEVEQGRTVVITNTKTDKRTAAWYKKSYEREKIGAYIIFPLMRGKLWTATLWVSDGEPREWQDWEISIIETIGERVWLAAEKIRSEQEVRESEERFRLATDAAEMFSWENDLTTNKMKWSENAAKVLGCQPEDLPDESENAGFFILPEIRTEVRREFAEAIADGQTSYLSEFRSINGKFWQAHGLIIRDFQGNPVKIIGVTQDITERKRYEEKLQTANYRFKIAEEAAKGFNYQWDLENRKITRSLSVKQVLGYAREELPMTWHGWTDLIHPDDKISSSEAEALEFLNSFSEDRFSSEYRVRHKEGHYIWVMERGLIIRDEAGKISRIIGQIMDVSERKEQVERLRESEEYRRLLIESAHDYAIIGISIEGIILSWSAGAEKMFRYTETEIIGQSRDTLFTPEELLADIPAKEIAIVLEKGSNDYERWHVRRDGSRFFASGVLQELRGENGRLLGFVKIARDQTEKLAAENAIRNHEMLKKVVGALEDERRRIARDLHDELGQQLTALRLKIEHCRKMIPDQSINKEIDEIQSIAQNIDKGVDFIAWQFRPAALDDLGLYAALDKFVREWSLYSGVKAELLPSSLKNVRFVMEIETNIYRIAQEALNNINKHAKAKSAELLLEKRDNLIVLIIADDGIGFDSTSKNTLNKGIGLIGMKERAALISGKIEIESAPGKGTTIYVRVPTEIGEN